MWEIQVFFLTFAKKKSWVVVNPDKNQISKITDRHEIEVLHRPISYKGKWFER